MVFLQERISVLKNISDNNGVTADTLSKIFNIEDLSPYENILITELDFNFRVWKQLNSNGYRTLAYLLKSSQQELSSLRNLGKGSFDNLIATLKNAFCYLPKYLSESTLGFDTDKFKNFANDLRFDARACAKKIVAALFNNEREFIIVCRRARGDTLEEIGKNFGLTRERVRKIEEKLVGKFRLTFKHDSDTKKMFYFLHALTDEKFLTDFGRC